MALEETGVHVDRHRQRRKRSGREGEFTSTRVLRIHSDGSTGSFPPLSFFPSSLLFFFCLFLLLYFLCLYSLYQQMPVMDGFVATRLIREREATQSSLSTPVSPIPIIAITANVMPGVQQRCSEAGMDGYVRYCFSPLLFFPFFPSSLPLSSPLPSPLSPLPSPLSPLPSPLSPLPSPLSPLPSPLSYSSVF